MPVPAQAKPFESAGGSAELGFGAILPVGREGNYYFSLKKSFSLNSRWN